MNHQKRVCAALLALMLLCGITACGKTDGSTAPDENGSAAAESAEPAGKSKDVAARPTADGIYISKEGVLKIPEKITLNGAAASVYKTLDGEDYRIEVLTGEIGGYTYTIREKGVQPASYVRYMNEQKNACMFSISGHAAVSVLYENCTADYVIDISSSECILLTVTPNDLSEKEAKKLYQKQQSEIAARYDAIITELIDASEIKWD